MNDKLIISISQDQANYLQRLGFEVDSKVFLMDRIFANHAEDPDASVIESIPFKHYMEAYEKAYAEYEMAKSEFEATFVAPAVKKKTGKNDVKYTWLIPNFSLLKCEVTII